jgi:AcrR family transcriptional regulator
MTSTTTGRRARNRAARHDQLLAAATELVAESGLDGLTMQGLSERVDCAVGTIYTYFPSKSALVASLMGDAIRHLMDTYHRAAARWDRELDDVDEPTAALTRILAFTQLFVASRELHPREFEFLQMLITTPESLIDPDDVASVLPQSLAFLADIHQLLEAAVQVGALDAVAGDESFRRTLRWTGAIHGALLVSNVADVSGLPTADAFSASGLADSVTRDLMLAWGAQAARLDDAEAELAILSADGLVVPTADASPAEP